MLLKQDADKASIAPVQPPKLAGGVVYGAAPTPAPESGEKKDDAIGRAGTLHVIPANSSK